MLLILLTTLHFFSAEQMQERRDEIEQQFKETPILMSDRALLTISCKDCDELPKVLDAGDTTYVEGKPFQVMHNGIIVAKNCYYGFSDWMSAIIYALRGHHEPQEERIFAEILKYIEKGSTMIELGSYWGYYSLWFAHEIKNATNYLIEPNHQFLEIGQSNFQINGYTGHFIHGFCGQNYRDSNESNLTQIKIDDLMQELDHVALLHSDIQGQELNMLRDCRYSLWARSIDFLFISTHSDDLHKQCLDYIEDFGYEIIAEHNVSQSFSADGLIVAKSPTIDPIPSISITRNQ